MDEIKPTSLLAKLWLTFLLAGILLFATPEESHAQEFSEEDKISTFVVSLTLLMVPIAITGTTVAHYTREKKEVSLNEEEVLDELIQMISAEDREIPELAFARKYPSLYRYQENKRLSNPKFKQMTRQELLDEILDDLREKKRNAKF